MSSSITADSANNNNHSSEWHKLQAPKPTNVVTAITERHAKCLTHEEECYLKTALAFVIVKRRLQNSQSSDPGGNNIRKKHKKQKHGHNDVVSPPVSILDELWNEDNENNYAGDNATCSSYPSYLLSTPADSYHVQSMMQVAITLVMVPPMKSAALVPTIGKAGTVPKSDKVNKNNNNNNNATKTMIGLATHVAQQIFLWINKDKNHKSKESYQPSLQVRKRDLVVAKEKQGKYYEEVQEWIRNLLVNPEDEENKAAMIAAASRVLQAMMEHGNAKPIVCEVISVVAANLLNALCRSTVPPPPKTAHVIAVQSLMILETASTKIPIASLLTQVMGDLLIPPSVDTLGDRYYSQLSSSPDFDSSAKILILLSLYRILQKDQSQPTIAFLTEEKKIEIK